MTQFRCVPIETEIATRFRATGIDDNGNTLRRMAAANATGFPCRHCLRCAASGEMMLLGSYNLIGPRGIYWTPSPIFVHADDCERFSGDDIVAPIIRMNPIVSVRAYDGADQCIYDLGQVCAGGDVQAPLAAAFADERTMFVNVHKARPGCLLARVERVG